MSIELIKVSTGDLDKVAALAYRIWQVHYPPIVGQAQVDYMLEKFYALDSLNKQQEEGQEFYLIRNTDTDIGFISISKKGEGDYFIHKFYIDAAEQGKGLGEKVFKLTRDLWKDKGSVTIRLTVNRQNYKAINFYFKIGFRIREVADFDIGEGFVMNDFVMEWKGKV